MADEGTFKTPTGQGAPEGAATSTRRTVFPEFPALPEGAGFGDRMQATLAWWKASRFGRTLEHNGTVGAPVMAAGMAYMALFSVFAGLWAAFSIVGFVVADNPEITQWLIDSVSSALPGLIGEGAAIDPAMLLNATIFGWTGLISLATTIWTALNWLTGARTAIRRIFMLPAAPDIPFALAKLRDLGLILLAVVMIVLSASFTAAGGGAVTWLLGLFGIGGDWVVREVLIQILGFLIAALVDAALLAGMIVVLSRIHVPKRLLWPGAIAGGIALGLIKLLASLLVGGATSNPLLASFAVLLSVLILFNLMATVQLHIASWVKVSMDDNGVAARRLTAEEAELEAITAALKARREVLAAEELLLRESLRDATRFTHRHERRRLREVQEARTQLERDDLQWRMWQEANPSATPDRIERARPAWMAKDVGD